MVPGADMTPEAALAKIGFLLEQSDLSYEQKQAVRDYMNCVFSTCIIT